MHRLGLELFRWYALLFCVFAYESESRKCIWKADRSVCAIPSAYLATVSSNISDTGSSNFSDCFFNINFAIQMDNASKGCSYKHSIDFYAFELSSSPRLSSNDLYFSERTESFNETHFTRYIRFKLSAFYLTKYFRLRIPSEVGLFAGRINNPNCTFSHVGCEEEVSVSPSYSTLEIFFKVDHAPIVSLEVLNYSRAQLGDFPIVADVLSLKKANLAGKVRIERSVGLVVNVNVRDYDVFEQNSDAFEYSSVSSVDVKLFASVQFSNKAHDFAHYSHRNANEVKLFTRPRHCHQVAWCEVEYLSDNVTKAGKRMQYRLDLTGLYAATKECYVKFKSKLRNLHFARVRLTIRATATSGTTNPLTSKATVTLAVLFPQSLKENYMLKTVLRRLNSPFEAI